MGNHDSPSIPRRELLDSNDFGRDVLADVAAEHNGLVVVRNTIHARRHGESFGKIHSRFCTCCGSRMLTDTEGKTYWGRTQHTALHNIYVAKGTVASADELEAALYKHERPAEFLRWVDLDGSHDECYTADGEPFGPIRGGDFLASAAILTLSLEEQPQQEA